MEKLSPVLAPFTAIIPYAVPSAETVISLLLAKSPPRAACIPAANCAPASPVAVILMILLFIAVVLASACIAATPPLPLAKFIDETFVSVPELVEVYNRLIVPLLVKVAESKFVAD